MSLDNVSRDAWIVGGLALLLAIDLLFLPWFSISFGFVTVTSTATGDPDGWLGILGALTAIALVVDVAVEQFSPQTTMPMFGGSRASHRLILAAATAVFVALKFLFHVHFSLFGFGFWAAAVLTIALVVATVRVNHGRSILPTA